MSHNAFKRRHCRNKSESKSESGFIGQVSLHKQRILLGKVSLNVLTQNIHYNTIQNKQCKRTCPRHAPAPPRGGCSARTSPAEMGSVPPAGHDRVCVCVCVCVCV